MAGFEAVASRQPLPQALFNFARGILSYAIDLGVVLPLFFCYFLLRGLPRDRLAQSTDNAFHIINFEKALGIFWEPSWQQAVIGNEHVVRAANFTYLNLHLPLLFVLGAVFMLADERKYRVIRNALLFSAFMAVPIYLALPVTPPRLMGSAGYPLGIFDTIPAELRTKPGALANWYAAVPSYHFGWIALAAAGSWWCWKHWLIRSAALLFAAWMWCSIVITGNHYFLDMLAGALMVTSAFWLALRFERWVELADGRTNGYSRFSRRIGLARLPF